MWIVAAAQSQPDFSGRWVLVAPTPTSSDAASVLVVEQPVTRSNIRGEPTPPSYSSITIRRERRTHTANETREIGISGGVVGGIVARTGERTPTPTTRFETTWHDNVLLLLDRVDGPDGPHTGDWSERREAWSLDPDGRLRIEIVTEAHDRPQQASVFLYRRE